MRPIIIALLLVLVSCKDNDPGVCGVEDPANDLPWLKTLIEFKKTDGQEPYRSMQYIMRAEYEGNIVFFDGDCCPNCNTLVRFYDCEGKTVDLSFVNDYDKLLNKTLVWKPDNSSCAFY